MYTMRAYCFLINFPKAKCTPKMAAALRVALPGGSGAKTAPIAFETCAKSTAQTLSVSAVEPLVETF
ncbi:MAG TPA: hypothetical protein VGC32_04815 [Solirubrobacterales bacterium]